MIHSFIFKNITEVEFNKGQGDMKTDTSNEQTGNNCICLQYMVTLKVKQ